MTASAVLTLGYGPSGSAGGVLRLGYGSAEPPAAPNANVITVGLGGPAWKMLTLGYGISTFVPPQPPPSVIRGGGFMSDQQIEVQHVSIRVSGSGRVTVVATKERETLSPEQQALLLMMLAN